MPTLNWIGKEAVVKHHKDVPFRLLEPVAELSCGDADSGNLIVQGDNLHALKAPLPRYAGQVKCIYIDPPYNTGNEGWVYNDNVNSPEIRKWLGEVVGKEGETLDRHDRWLCMMYPRLVLLKQFLREDGAIFVSIDDNEVGNLQALMREVFGASNEVANIVWEKGKKGDSKLVSVTHEYIVAFARNKALLKERRVRWRRRKPGIDAVLDHYKSLRKNHGESHATIRKEMMAWYRAMPKGDPRKSHKHYNWSDKRGLSAEPLFNAEGQIRSDVRFAQLAEFVWFAETGTGLTPQQRGQSDSPLLGVHEGRAISLLYNGILKDRSTAGGNVLTGPVFEVLPPFAGPKVIYAAANRMGNRAAREGITFKQTPYALQV